MHDNFGVEKSVDDGPVAELVSFACVLECISNVFRLTKLVYNRRRAKIAILISVLE